MMRLYILKSDITREAHLSCSSSKVKYNERSFLVCLQLDTQELVRTENSYSGSSIYLCFRATLTQSLSYSSTLTTSSDITFILILISLPK